MKVVLGSCSHGKEVEPVTGGAKRRARAGENGDPAAALGFDKDPGFAEDHHAKGDPGALPRRAARSASDF
jgi:hypothetical protein